MQVTVSVLEGVIEDKGLLPLTEKVKAEVWESLDTEVIALVSNDGYNEEAELCLAKEELYRQLTEDKLYPEQHPVKLDVGTAVALKTRLAEFGDFVYEKLFDVVKGTEPDERFRKMTQVDDSLLTSAYNLDGALDSVMAVMPVMKIRLASLKESLDGVIGKLEKIEELSNKVGELSGTPEEHGKIESYKKVAKEVMLKAPQEMRKFSHMYDETLKNKGVVKYTVVDNGKPESTLQHNMELISPTGKVVGSLTTLMDNGTNDAYMMLIDQANERNKSLGLLPKEKTLENENNPSM